MNQKHQAGFAQLLGDGKPICRTPAGAIERLLQINLRTRPLKAGNAMRLDGLDDAITRPARRKGRGLYIDIAFVIRMNDAFGQGRHSYRRMRLAGSEDGMGIRGAPCRPLGHATQLDATDNRLHLQHPPVGAEAFMQPAETRRVLPFIHGLVALAMVLVLPHRAPQRLVVGRDHAALAARGHDLVLAKRPGADVADRAHGPALVTRSVRLRAVFDHSEPMRIGQRHDRIHVARPTGQMHGDHRLGAVRDRLGNAGCRQIATVGLHIGKHWNCASIHDAGNAGDESARRDDHLIARTDAQRLERHIEGQRAVG